MYNNIGAKIKVLAQVIAWIGIIGSMIAGVIYMRGFVMITQDSGGEALVGVLEGFGIMIGGFLLSWISSWFMYGFGELIEKTTEIAKNTSFADSGLKKSFVTTCKCGAKNESGMKFCQNCGDPL